MAGQFDSKTSQLDVSLLFPATPNLLGISESQGGSYFTIDVLTEPPTLVEIVMDSSINHPPPHTGVNSTRTPAATITCADIEPTAGWLNDRSNHYLTICFMHSFGKCGGKGASRDPATCHQIHVKRHVLERIRQSYTNPQRKFFCRTMKASISEEFRSVLSALLQRHVTLQYLEFRLEHIEPTAGSFLYAQRYREWLLSETNTNGPLANTSAKRRATSLIFCTRICWDFAIKGCCELRSACPNLHGNIGVALTKDLLLKRTLEEMASSHQAICSPTDTQSSIAPQQMMYPMLHRNQLLMQVPSPVFGSMPTIMPQSNFNMGPSAAIIPNMPQPPKATLNQAVGAPLYCLAPGYDGILRMHPFTIVGGTV